MARLTPTTGKNQVDTKDHAAVDAIVQSRGAIQGPFMMFLHCPEPARRVADLGAFVRFEGSLDMRVRVLAARSTRAASRPRTPRSWSSPAGRGERTAWTTPPRERRASGSATTGSSSSRESSGTTACCPAPPDTRRRTRVAGFVRGLDVGRRLCDGGRGDVS